MEGKGKRTLPQGKCIKLKVKDVWIPEYHYDLEGLVLNYHDLTLAQEVDQSLKKTLSKVKYLAGCGSARVVQEGVRSAR